MNEPTGWRIALPLPLLLVATLACSLPFAAAETTVEPQGGQTRPSGAGPTAALPEPETGAGAAPAASATAEPIEISVPSPEALPPDLVDQLSWTGAGGAPPCLSPSDAETMFAYGDNQLTCNAVGGKIEGQWCLCDLADPSAAAQLTLPDGSVTTLAPQPDEDAPSCYVYEYAFGPWSPLGEYEFRLDQPGQGVVEPFSLLPPDFPCGGWLGDEAWFMGYQPGEEVRVLIYQGHGGVTHVVLENFIAERSARADANGMLRLRVQTYTQDVVVILDGPLSGQASAPGGFDRGLIYAEASGQQVSAVEAPSGGGAATTPSIDNLRFCDLPCDQPGATQTSFFPAGVQQIHAAWDYSGMQPGMRYTREWFNRGESWILYDCVWQGPGSGTWQVTLTEPGGLRSGTWELIIKVEGVQVGYSALTVDSGHEFWDPAGTRPCEDF